MGEYINKYANSAAIQSAVDGGELIKPYVALDESTGMIDWNSKKADYSKMPLTFEMLEDGTLVSWKHTYIPKVTIEYRINDGEWNTHINDTGYTDVLICEAKAGDKIQVRGDRSAYGNSNKYFCINSANAYYKVYGNIMSLINSTEFSGLTTLTSSYTFNCFFSPSNTGGKVSEVLTDISNLVLPATTLTEGCYYQMFEDCRGLSGAAPELPATTLAPMCYSRMFYASGFNKKSSLNYIKCLATDISASQCTQSWVNYVAPTGTFVTPSSTAWSTGTGGIPTNWTRVDA